MSGRHTGSGRDGGSPPLPVRTAGAAILCIALLAFLQSLDWRGAIFPGFFVMPNRVVPSAGLPGWSGLAEGRPPYQRVVLAVDGKSVDSAADVYRAVARHREGEPVQYVLAHMGNVETRTFPAHRLGDGEYMAIFGAYLLTGLSYLVLAVLAGVRWRKAPLYQGLATFGWVAAMFSITGIDLYGPGTLFRLHVLSEALLPAATAHLALVCPRNQLARRPGLLAMVYGSALAFAAVYELFLGQPSAYTPIHNLAQVLFSAPILALTVMLALTMSERPAGVRPKDLPLLLGSTLAGVLMPAFVLGISGLTGGDLPVNIVAWTGSVFPLGCILAFRLWPRFGTALAGRDGELTPA